MRKRLLFVAGVLLLAVSPLLSPVRAQVFLPYDAEGVTDSQRKSNPSRLAYPTRMQEQIKKDVKQRCGSIGGGESGLFTIGAKKKVTFSPGNLQYKASSGVWRFAMNQWDIVGTGYGSTNNGYSSGTVEDSNNNYISSSYDGWIDLFGWGTGNNPTEERQEDSNYSVFTDWGVNPISNGGNTPGQWRTLTEDEWNYLLNFRTSASRSYGAAIVNNVTGLILLPDEWTLPSGCSFTPGMTGASDGRDWSLVKNIYTIEQWQQMESAGAVFLPVAGYRNSWTREVCEAGYYWTATSRDDKQAYQVWIFSDHYYPDGMLFYSHSRHCGQAVRLVSDHIPLDYTLTITVEGEGTVTGGGTYTEDTEVKITAVPSYGYLFSMWSDGNTNNPRTITMTQDMTITAVFTKAGGSAEIGIGVFSVSGTKKVTFSPGNLQYQASTDTWRFAENQWDMVGMGYGQTNTNNNCYIGGTVENSDNRNISSIYDG